MSECAFSASTGDDTGSDDTGPSMNLSYIDREHDVLVNSKHDPVHMLGLLRHDAPSDSRKIALHWPPIEVLLIPKLSLFADMDDPNSTNIVPGTVEEDVSKQLAPTLPDPLFVTTISPP